MEVDRHGEYEEFQRLRMRRSELSHERRTKGRCTYCASVQSTRKGGQGGGTCKEARDDVGRGRERQSRLYRLPRRTTSRSRGTRFHLHYHVATLPRAKGGVRGQLARI